MAEKGGSADEVKPGGSADEVKPLAKSSVVAPLPGHKAAGYSGLVNAFKNKLQTLVGTSSGYIESLPLKIKKRVEALQKLQAQHDELVSKFLEEKAALEAKYQIMYEPLYNKRYDIVNGVTDVEDTEEEKTGQDLNKETTSEEKGIPEFWSTALLNNEFLYTQFTERDEDAIKFLKDIKWSRLDDWKGFKLEFFFNENPYFKNTVLTKTYYMEDDDDTILERATGTEIDWFPGKSLRLKVMKRRTRKGAKSGKTTIKFESCPSFFSFFSPPQIPESESSLHEDLVEDIRDLLDQDLDIGLTIRDKIIPRAVSWFTGEAVDTDDEDEDEDDDGSGDDDEGEDEGEDEDDDDKENDEEEDDHEEKDHGHQKRGVKAKPKISIDRAAN